jgi:hypothetical protein
MLLGQLGLWIRNKSVGRWAQVQVQVQSRSKATYRVALVSCKQVGSEGNQWIGFVALDDHTTVLLCMMGKGVSLRILNTTAANRKVCVSSILKHHVQTSFDLDT